MDYEFQGVQQIKIEPDEFMESRDSFSTLGEQGKLRSSLTHLWTPYGKILVADHRSANR